MKDYFVIVGKSAGVDVYWQRWTETAIAGRPKWVTELNPYCLFKSSGAAQKVVAGTGSTHYSLNCDLGIVTGVKIVVKRIV